MNINRFLGGASFLPLFAPETGAGAGGGDGGGDKGAAGGGATGAGDAGAAGGGGGGSAGAGSAAGAAGAAGGADAGAGAGAGTLAGGGADAAAAAAAAAAARPAFGDKWREELAGDDKDLLKDLAKYTDPKALLKSHRDLQTKISKGELRAPPAPMPQNATPEQVAAWRQAQGLPDKPEAFVEKLALSDGVVIGEADKPLVGEFAKMAFEKGWNQDQMNQAVSFYYDMQAAGEASRADADHSTLVAAQGELIGEWGQAEYKVNMNAVGSLLATMPDALRNNMLTARMPDGRMVGNTAEFNRWAAAQARELNPAATLVPVNDPNAMKTIEGEIAGLEKEMADQRSSYWRGPEANAKQARYRELVDAQQKMQSRGRAA
jgi:hypothetical protein